jgi:hypothetical protein
MNSVELFENGKRFEHIQTELNISSDFVLMKLAKKFEKIDFANPDHQTPELTGFIHSPEKSVGYKFDDAAGLWTISYIKNK